MSIERKIYSNWAFTENELEKGIINQEIYDDYLEKYNIARVVRHFNSKTNQMIETNLDDYDIAIECKSGLYTVRKNTPNLSMLELALICDKGSLRFGYTTVGLKIKINEK